MKKRNKVFITLLIIVIILAGGCAWYVSDYYHVTDFENAMSDTALVKITETDSGYLYDGPGEKNALIFYPGAKVQDVAYAPLLKKLAENGIDCFLIHMPCNLAFFGVNKADEILEQYKYEHWYLAGHSLGGAMAAGYAADNSEKLDGLIFLAAYSTKDLSKTGLEVLSIYGSEDKVVNMEKIESGRTLMPKSYHELCIEGGNHAGYADYGPQKGDGAALIDAKEQQQTTVEEILQIISAY